MDSMVRTITAAASVVRQTDLRVGGAGRRARVGQAQRPVLLPGARGLAPDP